jgi:hypothetical protein
MVAITGITGQAGGGVARTLLDARKKVRAVVRDSAQAKEEKVLSQLGLLEQGLGDLALPITILHPTWYMENAVWDLKPARDTGFIQSFLQSLGKAIPFEHDVPKGRVELETVLRTIIDRGP